MLPHLWGDVEFVPSAPIELEAFYNAQKSMFEFINFPWLKGEYPLDYQHGARIGILEVNLAAKHCDPPFDEDNQRIQIWLVWEPPVTPDAPAPLDIRRDLPPVADCPNNISTQTAGAPTDHGMQVLGIIGAAIIGKGVAGVNPYAEIYANEYKDTLLRGKQYQNAFADELKSLIFCERPQVVNMSFRYDPKLNPIDEKDLKLQPTTDLLQGAIAGSSKVLFVAAVDHVKKESGYNSSHFSNIYPACLNLPNLITGVSVNGDYQNPQVAPWANFADQLSLGAFGGNVLSTGAGNDFVLMKGSSMAAPQVAAVASLLFAHPLGPSPQQVKNRLLAGARPAPEMMGKMGSGVLDAECSLLKPELGRLVLANPQQTISGTIVGGGRANKPLRRPAFLDQETDEELGPSWNRIYAIRRDPAGYDRLILFTYEEGDRAKSGLVRRPGLVLSPDTDDQAMLFRTEAGQDVLIPLEGVVDFIAAID